MNLLKCQWCGFVEPPDNFELDETTGEGFWCPDCDGYTYYDDNRNHLRRVLLILEQAARTSPYAKPVGRKLHKRLSPLRYPGGKSKLIDFLANHFHTNQLHTFVEAFAGGASVGLSLLDAGLTKHLVLNDTDNGIYAFWRQVVTDPSPLLRRLSRTPNRADFRTAKEMLDEPRYWSNENLAWAQLLVNRLAYSGISKANALGGKSGSDDVLLSRWNAEELRRRITHIHELSDNIEVISVNAIDLIEQSAYWNEISTIFIDPPYVKQGPKLYRKYFSEEDHRQLAFIIESLYKGFPGADIIITYDDCQLIRDIYPFAKTIIIGRNYSI